MIRGWTETLSGPFFIGWAPVGQSVRMKNPRRDGRGLGICFYGLSGPDQRSVSGVYSRRSAPI